MRTTLAVIIFVVMIILCAVILIVFRQYMKNNIMGGTETVNTDHDHLTYYTDNVLELSDFLGKTFKETGLDEKYVRGDIDSLNVAFDGKLFDKAAYGTFYFSYDHTDNDAKSTVKTIYIHTKEMDYNEAKEKLSEIYGEAKDEFEEPYVEVNGGAVMRCFFNAEGYTVKLASASEYDYIDIILSINE